MIPLDSRQWPYFVIAMPINAEGQGPVSHTDAVMIEYEVWDWNYDTHGVYQNLFDAINQAMKLSLNHLKKGLDSSPD